MKPFLTVLLAIAIGALLGYKIAKTTPRAAADTYTFLPAGDVTIYRCNRTTGVVELITKTGGTLQWTRIQDP